MALAAYTFIQTVNITDNNTNALVAAANLLCLIGQNPQNTTLIDEAKAVAAYYAYAADAAYNNAYRAAAYAADAADAADAAYNAAYADAVYNAADAAKAAAVYAYKDYYNAAAYAASASAAVIAVAASAPNNLPSTLTCAAGLIYLNIYTLLPQ